MFHFLSEGDCTRYLSGSLGTFFRSLKVLITPGCIKILDPVVKNNEFLLNNRVYSLFHNGMWNPVLKI